MRLLAVALASALALPVAAAAEPPVYVAQSLFGAKSLIHLDAWLSLRPPWEEKPGGKGVRIGLVDTGLDGTHPDLQGALACRACWRDFVGDGTLPAFTIRQPYDDHGHGTHVAGILASRGHLQWDPLRYYWLTGARGIAPEATLIVAKAMDSRGEGDDQRVAAALRWVLDPDGDPATDDGADVINLSLGIEEPREAPGGRSVPVGSETRDAILLALSHGVPVVASSGNEGKATITEPGEVRQVLTVGAVDGNGQLAAFSNRGEGLDLLAPGILVSTYPLALDDHDFARDGYAAMAGTSMAAPVVAGTLALVMEADPRLEPGSQALPDGPQRAARLASLLQRTADPVEEPGGAAGLVDAHAALSLVARGSRPVAWEVLGVLVGGLALLALLGWRVARNVQDRRAEQQALAIPRPRGASPRSSPATALPAPAPPASATPSARRLPPPHVRPLSVPRTGPQPPTGSLEPGRMQGSHGKPPK